MWEMFDELTLKGYTLSRIRNIFEGVENHFLDNYTDIPLLQRMIRTFREVLPVGVG